MSIKHCEGCGQNLKKERRGDPGLCETCERAERSEELEVELQEARAELEQLREERDSPEAELEGSEESELEKRIIELLSLGLSPSQVLDYIFTQERGYSVQQWASKRRVTKPAVYNNLSSAEPEIKEQTDLSQFELQESVAESEQLEREVDGEAARDARGAHSEDPVGFE